MPARSAFLFVLLSGAVISHAAQADKAVSLQAGTLRIELLSTGRVHRLYDSVRNEEHFPAGESAPLLSIGAGERVDRPTAMSYTEANHELRLIWGESGITATVEVRVRPTHVTFELKEVSGAAPTQITWGPLPTTIHQTIGETVGVVRDDHFAIGIQALNTKTSAGAAARDFGSVLQASAEDRTRDRVAGVWQVKEFTVPPCSGPDAGVQGSKIALFGCPADQALETIGSIEVAEGLPHPMLEGMWAKISPAATRSYLIISFNEGNLDEVLAAARQAGLKYIYHMNPFKSWGHFALNSSDFPDGVESLRRCVERAGRVGIRVGVHTLSNFVHPHDPYVSPVPDPRLARIGSTALTAPVDDKATTIPVADPTPFRYRQFLSTAVVGEELVQYDGLSETEPWKLLDCKRGAFGTRAAAHAAGAEIGKLWDHAYRVFFPNLELQDELASRLVELFNSTGLGQISFDGLEGCQVTGQGAYAEARFVKKCFDGWKFEVINDSSQLKHYTWHIHTRMNWGEPWGKAMREGMPEYRFKNQEYFRRNLLPPMLGWFQIQPASAELEATSLDEAEWVLAKCAGFCAGCAWVTGLNALEQHGQTETILAAIREWDRARHNEAFSDGQRARLKDPKSEFHLEPMGIARWRLWPVAFSPPFSHSWRKRQPGEPAAAQWEVNNQFARQPLRFTLRVVLEGGGGQGESVGNPTFQVGIHEVTFPVRLQPRQYLVCEGEGKGLVYDMNWNLLKTVPADPALPTLPSGTQPVRFRCEFAGELKPRVEVRFKTIGSPEPVG